MTTPSAPTSTQAPPRRRALDKFLNGVEWLGNKLPEPFTLFIILFLITGVASTIMAAQHIEVTVPGSDKVMAVKGLFTGEGMRWMTTTIADNYLGFPPLKTVLTILLGVAIAEQSGMLSALIRRLFGSARGVILPYAVGVVGVTASVMADAAWAVVPPLAAMVFKAAGRHPVAGLLGGFAAVGAGYSTALVPTSLDALFAGITNAVMASLPEHNATQVNVLSNYYFNIASSIVLGILAGYITDKVLEPRLWAQDVPTVEVEKDGEEEELSPNLEPNEKKGLIWSLVSFVVVTAVLLVAVLPQGSPWRNEAGGFLPKSPFLDSIIFIVFAYFAVMGLVYGYVAGTIRNMSDVVEMMVVSIKDMGSFLVLAFILGQFVALFTWTGIGTYTAVRGAAALQAIGLTGFGAILAFIVLASCLNLLIISGSGMWTLMAAVFVPMFALLGFEPSFVQAAFRVGDSATQVITPLNPFMVLIIGMVRKYEPEAGLGTVMSRMVPFVIPFWLAWAILLAIWYYANLPLGPGSGIMIH